MAKRNKKRKRYMVTKDSEAFACSLVTDPAIESDFLYFSEDKPLITNFSDDEKHIIVGAVAIPNKPIYRRGDNGEEYDLVFSEEAITSMAYDFMKNGRQKEVTLQHEQQAEGLWLVEQWIKEDMVYDKSIALGLEKELPKGTWFQMWKCDSVDVWNRVKDGELRGFSLECVVGLEEFEKQIPQLDMDEDTFFSKIKKVILEALSMTEDKQDETVDEVVETELEAVEAPIEAPQATETVEVVETPTEPIESPTEPIQSVEEAQSLDEKDGEIVQLKDLLENLKEEVKALREANGGLEARIKEMSKEPSAKPISVVGGARSNDPYLNWRSQMKELLR